MHVGSFLHSMEKVVVPLRSRDMHARQTVDKVIFSDKRVHIFLRVPEPYQLDSKTTLLGLHCLFY